MSNRLFKTLVFSIYGFFFFIFARFFVLMVLEAPMNFYSIFVILCTAVLGWVFFGDALSGLIKKKA
jgi:hypothetical protein